MKIKLLIILKKLKKYLIFLLKLKAIKYKYLNSLKLLIFFK